MFDLDHWREIWEALSKNKLRTFLTAFGVFWGIFLLILLLGSGNGLSNGVNAGFAGGATNSFFCWAQRTSKPYLGLQAGREVEFDNQDTLAIRREIPEAAVVAPRNQLGGFRGGNNIVRGANVGAFGVTGDYPEIFVIQSMLLVKGRFLNALDLADNRKVAVIGTRVLEVLFEPGEDPLGEDIAINGVYFKVVGVFKSRQTGNQADRDAQTVYVPFTTFQQAFNFGTRVSWFAVTSQAGIPASEVEEKVLTLLRARHKIAPDDRRAIGHFNLETEYRKIQGLFEGIHILMWVVGLGTLAAGAIGVSNIMLIIVKERTKEIGIRRAVGATPLWIMSQIVVEAVILTGVAGYLGLAAGVGLLEVVARVMPKGDGTSPQMFLNPGVDFSTGLQALLILVVAGTVAGLIPAQRAIATSPVVALRTE